MKNCLFILLLIFSQISFGSTKRIITADLIEGQSELVNYLGKKGHFEKNVNGWSAYDDAAETSDDSMPGNGTGGTPTITCTQTTSAPIDGAGSLLITHAASNQQGQGCSTSFTTVVKQDAAKVFQIEFEYMVASGTFAAGSSSSTSDIVVYIYDVTNSTLIQPSSYKLLASNTTLSTKFIGNFQTSASATSYRLILHAANTTATAFTLAIDNIKVTQTQYVYGTPITDWQSYTPTGLFTAGVTYTGFWRRVGDTMELRGKIAYASAISPSTSATVNLPSGYSIDTSKLTTATNITPLGWGHFYDSSVPKNYEIIVNYSSTTRVKFLVANASATELYEGADVSDTAPVAWASGDYLEFQTIGIPISGWSSSVQMSDQSDTRIVAAIYSSPATTSLVSGTQYYLDYATKVLDTHSAVSGTGSGHVSTSNTGWKFTAPVPGVYKVTYYLQLDALAGFNGIAERIVCAIYVNGSNAAIASRYVPSSTQTSAGMTSIGYVNLNAGDYVELGFTQDSGSNWAATNATSIRASIERISGPSQIAASELVAFAARGTPTGSLSGSYATTIFGTETEDTHGAYDTSTGIFTVPISGRYKCNWNIGISGTYAASTENSSRLYKNNATELIASVQRAGGSQGALFVNGSWIVSLIAGDTLRMQSASGATSPTYYSGATSHSFTCQRIGL